MNTKINISFGRRLSIAKYNLKHKVNFILGKVYAKFLSAHEYYLQQNFYHDKRLDGPLSDDKIQEITDWQESEIGVESITRRSKSIFTKEMMNYPARKLSGQHKATKFIYEIISANKDEIKTVANIGARVDTVSQYLSGEFQDIDFYSVDFQSNLKEANSYFEEKRSNRKYLSGYALNLLTEGKLKADLIFMTSTTVLLQNKEFDAFLAEFAKTAKFVVLNESWHSKLTSFNIFSITKPEEIDPNVPYTSGHRYLTHHNYIKKFEENGFKVIVSQLEECSEETQMVLQLVAKKV